MFVCFFIIFNVIEKKRSSSCRENIVAVSINQFLKKNYLSQLP
jgi:hypothetical protein